MNEIKQLYKGISLFSGAGGMDVGFKRAGIELQWANEIDKNASCTFELNHPGILKQGDIRELMPEVYSLKNIDIVFGGPPCQGFSVAGKMNPEDERNTLLWAFLDVVERVQPRGFVCENVKALGKLRKWRGVCQRYMQKAEDLGYGCTYVLLDSSEFGVPQKRERVFFIGVKGKNVSRDILLARFAQKKSYPPSIKEAIKHLGPAGSEDNENTCIARITMASNPVLRRSPYAGMLFNGLGRPLNLDGVSSTLPASMGGNKTPIIDENYLQGLVSENWVISYHKHLLSGGEPLPFEAAPKTLRRLTLKEAIILQSFPEDYKFFGRKTSIYKQVGNAVPCGLAEAVGKVALEEIEGLSLVQAKERRSIQQELMFR